MDYSKLMYLPNVILMEMVSAHRAISFMILQQNQLKSGPNYRIHS